MLTVRIVPVCSCFSFFENLDRLSQPGYIPTHEDILYARQATQGVQERKLSIHGYNYRLDHDLVTNDLVSEETVVPCRLGSETRKLCTKSVDKGQISTIKTSRALALRRHFPIRLRSRRPSLRLRSERVNNRSPVTPAQLVKLSASLSDVVCYSVDDFGSLKVAR